MLNYLENTDHPRQNREQVERASLPLQSIESRFACDSTGFACSRFARWYDIKYNRFTSEQQWVKAHLILYAQENPRFHRAPGSIQNLLFV